MFKVGDKVVYPHHGAGTVVKKEQREVLGQKRDYLTIKILHNDMTVNVPCENAEKVGLRRVIDEVMVEKVLKALQGSGTTMPKNWNRRFKHNRDKMKTGDIFELAEVVRNLSLRDHEKGLSTGEKQMFVKAKKILASELMYAKAMDEDEAAVWLDEVLSTVATARRRPRRSLRARARSAASDLSCRSGPSSPPPVAASGSAWTGRRPSPRSAVGRCWPRAWSASRRRPGSSRSSSSRRRGGRSPSILLAEELGCGKVVAAVAGGETRTDSVRIGVGEVADDAAVILVHDAARPLLPDDVVERVLAPLGEGWDGAVPGPAAHRHGQAGSGRRRRGDAAASRAGDGADAAGVRRVRVPRGSGRLGRRDGLLRHSSRPGRAG